MKRIVLSIFILTFILGSLWVDLLAQTGGGALPYQRIGVNPRILAIGNAYVAGNSLGIYPQFNPAHASQGYHNQIDISGAIMSFDRNLASASITFPLPPNAGLHIAASYAGVNNFDGRTPSGYYTESFSTHDLQLSATFGLRLNEQLSLGTTARFLTARYNPEIPAPISFGVDIGIRYTLNDKTSIGFAIQDLLSELTWDTQDLYNTAGSILQKDTLPTRLKLGIQHLLPIPTLTLFVEAEHRIQSAQRYKIGSELDLGRPVTRILTSTETFTSQFVRIGLSWEAHERLALRSGWQSGDTKFIGISQRFSGGFSIKLPFDQYRPEIDYAIMREPQGISWINMFAIRLHLND
jgi:hypothetical protein